MFEKIELELKAIKKILRILKLHNFTAQNRIFDFLRATIKDNLPIFKPSNLPNNEYSRFFYPMFLSDKMTYAQQFPYKNVSTVTTYGAYDKPI